MNTKSLLVLHLRARSILLLQSDEMAEFLEFLINSDVYQRTLQNSM